MEKGNIIKTVAGIALATGLVVVLLMRNKNLPHTFIYASIGIGYILLSLPTAIGEKSH